VLGCLAERPGQALSPTAIADDTGPLGRGGRHRPAGAGRPWRGDPDPEPKPRRYTSAAAGGDQTDAQR
jgi:hypothetical protein